MRDSIDLLDPHFYAPDPHEAYAWMRAHEPVFRDEKNELWAVTKNDDVREVELNDEVFVSGRGYRAVHYPDETNMIARDDPRHAQQRKLVRRRFTPPGLRDHEAEIGELVSELVDAMADAGEAEVIDDLAAQLPTRVICRLLGFPEDDWPMVKRWSEDLMRTDMTFRDPDQGRWFGDAAVEDAEVREQRIAEGDKVILLYPSANRDEDGFDDPFTFDVR